MLLVCNQCLQRLANTDKDSANFRRFSHEGSNVESKLRCFTELNGGNSAECMLGVSRRSTKSRRLTGFTRSKHRMILYFSAHSGRDHDSIV